MSLLLWGVLLGVFVGGCGDRTEEGKVVDSLPREGEELIGTWTTSGVDEALGEVSVAMGFEEDGRLHLVVRPKAGGQLGFWGTWEVEEDQLWLRGEYFKPSGVSQVKWTIQEDGMLTLEDEAGGTEKWKRS